jgi:hypothetical protein
MLRTLRHAFSLTTIGVAIGVGAIARIDSVTFQSALQREAAGCRCDDRHDHLALHLLVVSGIAARASGSICRPHAGTEN